jgi:hypothetical protein
VSISRDEAREVAILALLATAALRVLTGALRVLEELSRNAYTTRSLLTELFSPLNATAGGLVLGAVLLVVLAPRGSLSSGMETLVRRAAAIMFGLGVAATVHTVFFSLATGLGRWWFAMINGMATAILAGTGYWILRNFDPDR